MFKAIQVCFLLLILTACGRQQEQQYTYNTDPGKDSSIFIESTPDSAQMAGYTFSDTLNLIMDSTGKIGWIEHPIDMTDLQQEVQDSLISIYLHTGKLPSRLDVQYEGTVTMGIRGAADDMIRQVQIVVMNVASAAEYHRPYGKLQKKEQMAFRKKYPVLFEKYY